MRDTMVAEFSLRTRRGLWVLPLVAALAGVFGWSCAVAAGLNDTGVTTCADASGATVSCTAATAVQGQDARYGRDAAAGTSALSKVGGGANGFDFSKVKNSGVIPLANNASLSLGAGNDDWGCTYDNTTGLMWEVKTTSGLRSQSHIYTWYDTNPATNGGSVGNAAGGVCLTGGRCDTEKYTQDVNAATMCGHSDWRMPTFRELQGLVRLGVGPTIDGAYFPNTVPLCGFWSASPVVANASHVWFVYFGDGSSGPSPVGSTNFECVRLVRVGR